MSRPRWSLDLFQPVPPKLKADWRDIFRHGYAAFRRLLPTTFCHTTWVASRLLTRPETNFYNFYLLSVPEGLSTLFHDDDHAS